MEWFVLIMNNGCEYEDYKEYIMGLFASKFDAVEAGKKESRANWGFQIQRWATGAIGTPEAIYNFEMRDGKLYELVEIN